MELHWTTGMEACLYDPESNNIVEGRIKALCGTKIGERTATLLMFADGKDVTVPEANLCQEWEQAWIKKQEAIKAKMTPVRNLQAITGMIESIMADPSTKMTDLNRNLMQAAVKQLKDATCQENLPETACPDEYEQTETTTYLAYMADHAVRDVQYDKGYMSEYLDDDAWQEWPNARIFISLFTTDTEEHAKELAARFADTDPRNIEVIPIKTTT